MNRKQKICLWIGIAVIVAMGIYPPWIKPIGDGCYVTPKPKYSFILTPSGGEHTQAGCYLGRVDTSQLFAQWLVVAVVTGGLIVTLADKKSKS